VELCGAATLELKRCTDEHPEYYGALGGEGEAAGGGGEGGGEGGDEGGDEGGGGAKEAASEQAAAPEPAVAPPVRRKSRYGGAFESEEPAAPTSEPRYGGAFRK